MGESKWGDISAFALAAAAFYRRFFQPNRTHLHLAMHTSPSVAVQIQLKKSFIKIREIITSMLATNAFGPWTHTFCVYYKLYIRILSETESEWINIFA